MPTVQPTTENRIVALDVIRGVAILGILLANIEAFAFVMEFKEISLADATFADRVTTFVGLAFVNGKFRSMLAILFGIGVCLQFVKRWEAGAKWPQSYFPRVGWLLAIGLIHFVFLWAGDILAFYAVVAFFMALLARAGRTAQLVVIVIGGLMSLGLGALMLLLQALPKFTGTYSDSSFGSVGVFERIPEVMTSGNYFEQVALRLELLPWQAVFYLFLTPSVLALFCVGFLLARSGVVSGENPSGLRKLVSIGLVVGLPLNLLSWTFFAQDDVMGIRMFTEFVSGPLLACGYFGLLLLWVRSGCMARVQETIARVGRMALSNYLLQSVICVLLFSNWTFGLFERLTLVQALHAVPFVWVANIAFSTFWLSRYRMGPVEWVWRCLAERQRLPLRRSIVA